MPQTFGLHGTIPQLLPHMQQIEILLSNFFT